MRDQDIGGSGLGHRKCNRSSLVDMRQNKGVPCEPLSVADRGPGCKIIRMRWGVVSCRVLLALRLLGFAVVLSASPARAVQPDEILKDPVLESRARSITAGLRCLVCQNESVDDSQAPLARDLRLLVRERLQAGDTDAAVRDYLVARYGDFVLLKPPFKPETLVLWTAPFLALAVGAFLLVLRSRSQGELAGARPLSAEEQARIQALVDRPGESPPS